MSNRSPVLDSFDAIVNSAKETPDADNTADEIELEGEEDTSTEDTSEDLELEIDDAEETPSNELSIDLDDKAHKFKLDPKDKDLNRTLKRGLLAPKLVRERETKIKELTTQVKELTAEKTHADELKTIRQMVEAGHPRQALKQLFGDEGFKKFFEGVIYSRVKAELAEDSAAAKAALAKQEADEDKQYADYTKEKEFQKREEALKSKEEIREKETHVDLAQAAYEKFSFKDLNLPAAVEKQFQEKMWKLAMNDIMDFVEEYKEANNGEEPSITYKTYEKAFKKNYAFLRERSNFLGAQETKKKSDAQKTEVKKAKDIGKKNIEKATGNKKSQSGLSVMDRFEQIKNAFK